jgi:hypothetical protein
MPALLALVTFALTVHGCSRRPTHQVAAPGEQAFDRVFVASFDSTAWSGARSYTLPAKAYRRAPQKVMAKSLAHPAAGHDSAHFHSVVRHWLADSASAPPRAQLILVFRDSVEAPRFPAALADTLIGSPVWMLQRHVADSLVAATQGRRAARYAADSLALAARGVFTLDRAWLIQSMLVDAPISRSVLRAIVDTIGAVYVQPRYAGEHPPDNGFDGDDPIVARDQIDSDPYVPFAPQYGRIALLDTGVRKTHQFLAERIATTYDCLTGDCVEADTSAALLSGTESVSRTTSRFAGVTDARLDVYGVYKADDACATGAQMDTWAAEEAIAHAAAQSIPIIVAELDGEIAPDWGYDEEDWNALAHSADEAFEKGSLVVAAAGDQGVGDIASPAVARRVLAAGGYHVVTASRYSGGGTGPTKDGRYKPEVSGPTNTETAGNRSDSDFHTFGATSGATPYVAGGAALVRNWLVQAAGGTESNIDPGQVCAQIILSGQSPSSPPTGSSVDVFDTKEGAGKAILPTNGFGCFGKVSIDATGTVVEIEIAIAPNTVARLEAALWWPETPLSEYSVPPATDTHNDIDLEIVDPSGNVATDSRVAAGVFERATATPPSGTSWLADGTWKLRIIGNALAYGPQTVYWTAGARF